MIGFRSPNEAGMPRARAFASRADSWPPSGLPPGNDAAFVAEDLLDRWGVDIAVLNAQGVLQVGYQAGNEPDELAVEIQRASNDWLIDEFLDVDPRFFASICVPVEHPVAATDEITRLAPNRRFCQVILPAKMEKPIGNRKYWPIFEAACAFELPVALHPGGTGMWLHSGAGWPSYYFEEHCGFPLAYMSQVASLITEGVFEEFPSLQVVLVEGGWSWVAPLMWRFDRSWHDLRREVPHLTRQPSEYLAEHFYFTTQPIEEPPKARQFDEALEHFGLVDRLMFSSDYPHWDFDAPEQSLPRGLSEAIRNKISFENALALYRFPKEPPKSGWE